jgi:LysM repeat protein
VPEPKPNTQVPSAEPEPNYEAEFGQQTASQTPVSPKPAPAPTPKPQPAPPSIRIGEPAPGTSPATSGKRHTVVKGDTLYNIAKRYTITVQQLKDLNEMADEGIKIGQVLVVGE